MNQALPNAALGTRLVRFLSDLDVSDVAFSHRKFAERLSRLIDFGDSMRLSEVYDKLPRMTFESASVSSEKLREDVVQVRMRLVQSVVESFSPSAGSARTRLPELDAGAALDELARFEPYLRFYAAHQRQFEYHIQSLQLRVRDAVSGVSAELSQLAALDEAVRNSLSAHTRKYFAVIPRLLGKRFDFLLQEFRSLQGGSELEMSGARSDEEVLKMWTRPNGWLNRFFNEMQGLLLAELELRLLPVMGLIEAVNEEAGQQR